MCMVSDVPSLRTRASIVVTNSESKRRPNELIFGFHVRVVLVGYERLKFIVEVCTRQI